MAEPIFIDVTPVYQSIYTLSGITAGTLVHIDCSLSRNGPLAVRSAASKPDDNEPGISMQQGDRLDTESNDVDVWIRGNGKVSISEIPTS